MAMSASRPIPAYRNLCICIRLAAVFVEEVGDFDVICFVNGCEALGPIYSLKGTSGKGVFL